MIKNGWREKVKNIRRVKYNGEGKNYLCIARKKLAEYDTKKLEPRMKKILDEISELNAQLRTIEKQGIVKASIYIKDGKYPQIVMPTKDTLEERRVRISVAMDQQDSVERWIERQVLHQEIVWKLEKRMSVVGNINYHLNLINNMLAHWEANQK